MGLEHENDKRLDYRACSVSVQCVRLKEETEEHEYEGASDACVQIVKQETVEQAECGKNTAAWTLYEGHEIKDELVVGPELIELSNHATSLPEAPNDADVLEYHHLVNYKDKHWPPTCSVKVECPPVDKEEPLETTISGSVLLTQGPPEDNEIISKETSTCTESRSSVTTSNPSARLRACSVSLERLSGAQNKQLTCIMLSQSAINHTKNEIKTNVEVHSFGIKQETIPPKKSSIQHIFHSPKKVKKRKIKCEICLRKFTSLKYLVRHIEIHMGKSHECKICNKKFLFKRKWVRHMEAHSTNKLDSHLFSQDSKLFSHEDTKKAIESYKCVVCLKTYSSYSNLQKHRSCHFSKVRYKCNICLKKFATSKNFLKHDELHKKEGTFKCKYCMKQFFKPSRLIEHERIHTGDKPYKCNHCQRGFARKRYAATHMKTCQNIQSKILKYKCEICPKYLATSYSLTVHTRLHTGERPFHCMICMKKFRCAPTLHRHEKWKHGTYTCDVCREDFNDKDKLRVHIERLCSVACAMCGARFEDGTRLRRHARRHIWPDEACETPGDITSIDGEHTAEFTIAGGL